MPAPQDLIVIGGGEHARVVIEAARSRPDLWNVVGFTAPQPCEDTSSRLGVPHLGGDEEYLGRRLAGLYVLGIGAVGITTARQRVAERYQAAGVTWARVVHERAWVSPTASLGGGTVVLAAAALNTGASLGEHCTVGTGAVVEHDVCLGPGVQVAPGAVVCGGVTVGRGSYLGAGCRVRDHVPIGRDVVVGMGAVVVGPVPDGAVVVGVPAKPVGARRRWKTT